MHWMHGMTWARYVGPLSRWRLYKIAQLARLSQCRVTVSMINFVGFWYGLVWSMHIKLLVSGVPCCSWKLNVFVCQAWGLSWWCALEAKYHLANHLSEYLCNQMYKQSQQHISGWVGGKQEIGPQSARS